MKSLAAAFSLVLLVTACSKSKDNPPATTGSATPTAGSGSATTPPPPAPDAAAAEPAGSGSDTATAGSGSASGEFDFDELSYEEKRAFMKDHVVPTMKPMFQKFDPEKFASFGCKTCHGKEPQKVKYKMPSDDTPALDFAALELGKQKPETAKWMSKVVKPEMAKLLQLPEMSKSNPKGFGCLACHNEKK